MGWRQEDLLRSTRERGDEKRLLLGVVCSPASDSLRGVAVFGVRKAEELLAAATIILAEARDAAATKAMLYGD